MDKRRRSIVKAITFRIIATLITLLVVWLFTKNFALSLGAAIIDGVIKMTVYYVHERAWNHLSWGMR